MTAEIPPRAAPDPQRETVLVDLALQGGGAHGAFTWGVHDRLLDVPWLDLDGISGTSAGAMNAVVMVDGLVKGGRAGAKASLEKFWRRISDAARFSPIQRGPLEILTGNWTLDYSLIGEASDGAEAVRLVEEKKPDLVLMDVHMPVMDGIEATRRIRAACQRIKVVVYTMYPDSEREAVLAGADIFLLKGSPDAGPIRAILSLFPSRDFTP